MDFAKQAIESKNRIIKTLNDRVVLSLIVVLALAIRLRFFVGVFRFDMFFYSQLSYFISRFDLHSFFFNTNNYFATERLLLFLPTGLFYRLFGINDFTSVAFILFWSLVNVIAVYFLGKKLVNRRVGLVSAFILAIFPLEVLYSTQYLPDGLIAAFLTISAVIFIYAEAEMNLKRSVALFFLSGVFFGLAQFVRENAFLFFAVFFLYVLYRRKFNWKYIWGFIGFAFVYLLGSTFYLLGSGDFFYQGNILLDTFLKNKETLTAGSHGLSYWFGFTRIILFGGVFKPFCVLLIVSIIYGIFGRAKNLIFLLIWFFTFYLYLEFGSHLHNLEKTDRYLTIINTPMVLMIGTFLVDVYERLKVKLVWAFLGLFLLTVISMTAIQDIRVQFRNNRNFINYRVLASSLRSKPLRDVYVQNLQSKGFIFNYVIKFKDLNYNSFQRERVEGTDSLLRNWNGVAGIPKDSYVVIDSPQLLKNVQPNWERIAGKYNATLFYVPK